MQHQVSGLDRLEHEDDETEDEGEGGARGGGKQLQKRPLDLGYGDKENGDAEELKEGEQQPVAEELKTKKKKMARPFSEDVLASKDGLARIYEEFPLACQFRGRGFEAQDAKRLVTMYKEWAFQLHPGLAFPDLLNRCESLGAKGKVRTHLEQLRERERCRYLNEFSRDSLSKTRVEVSSEESQEDAKVANGFHFHFARKCVAFYK